MGLAYAVRATVRVQVHHQHVQRHRFEIHVQDAALEGGWAVLAQHGEGAGADDAHVVRLQITNICKASLTPADHTVVQHRQYQSSVHTQN
jgi:hypothetical protein